MKFYFPSPETVTQNPQGKAECNRNSVSIHAESALKSSGQNTKEGSLPTQWRPLAQLFEIESQVVPPIECSAFSTFLQFNSKFFCQKR